jgi:hypothetical protein
MYLFHYTCQEHAHILYTPYSNLLSFCTYLLAEIDLNEALHAIGRSIKDVTKKIKTFLASLWNYFFSAAKCTHTYVSK